MIEDKPKSPKEKMIEELSSSESFRNKDGSVINSSLLGDEEVSIYRILDHVRSGKIEKLEIFKDMVKAYRDDHLSKGGASSSTESPQICFANWLGNKLTEEEALHELTKEEK